MAVYYHAIVEVVATGDSIGVTCKAISLIYNINITKGREQKLAGTTRAINIHILK